MNDWLRVLRGGLLAPLLPITCALAVSCTEFKRRAYEDFGDRDPWQQPERVVESLGLAPGARVADLGAGGGYFTFRLAEAVGTAGRVYAVDVDEGMIDYVRTKAAEDGYAQVEPVLAPFDDPTIPEAVDLVFTCNTYHHLEERSTYFRTAKKYLKPGGQVAIIEYKPGGGWFEGRHATSPDVIRSEMEDAGFRLEKDLDFLERQSFLIFALAETP